VATGPYDRSAADAYALLLDALAVEVPGGGAKQAAVLTSSASGCPSPGLAEALAAGRVSPSSTTAAPPVDRRRPARASEDLRIVTFASQHRCWPLFAFRNRHSP
jgi:hypothetical protein